MSRYETIREAAKWLHLFVYEPKVGVILGSGLGALAESLGDTTIDQVDVPGWPRPTVQGHRKTLHTSRRGVVTVAGRVHLYEGFSAQEVVHPIRALVLAGCQTIVLTNAAGGINPQFGPGQLVLIRDHLNLTGTSPLVGLEDEQLGPRFPDMTEAYAPSLRALAQDAARSGGMGTLAEGVYAGLCGPAYETPAEVRMLATLGADLAGMSTVLETIAARHMGARVLGISCVTNLAAGVGPYKLDHEEVLEVGAQVAPKLAVLINKVIDALL